MFGKLAEMSSSILVSDKLISYANEIQCVSSLFVRVWYCQLLNLSCVIVDLCQVKTRLAQEKERSPVELVAGLMFRRFITVITSEILLLSPSDNSFAKIG